MTLTLKTHFSKLIVFSSHSLFHGHPRFLLWAYRLLSQYFQYLHFHFV